jgi:pantetheine-phosphate adenylyltransferase
MIKKAIFPGSFDPLTKGHEAIVKRALPLFDEIVVAVGENSSKKYMYSLEQRIEWIKQTFANEPKITHLTYQGLTVDFCKKVNAQYILRGIRSAADFEFEREIAQMNKAMAPEIETIFIISSLELSAVTSTIIRDIIKNGGDVSAFVPGAIKIK